MLKIAICDDVCAVCADLECMILEYQQQNNEELSVEVFYSGEKLIEYIKKENRFDLIFLDIELGAINGVNVGLAIREEMQDYITKIVYISSKNDYDRQLFDVQPLHFLAKPLQKEKVFRDIKLAIKVLNKENNLFSVKIGHETHKISITEILYFESVDRKIKLVTAKEILFFYDKIDIIARQFLKSRFMFPHRSYVVNYDQIISIKSNQIIMSNNDIIPISRLKAGEIMAQQIAFEEDK